jgi:ribosome-binding protein aMBF1 (putative translation factor)
MSFAHQDWNTVILRPNKSQTVTKEKQLNNVKSNHTSQTNNTIISKNKLDDNPETFNHKGISKELADTIKNKRIELKLTQGMLAQKINEKVNVIQEVENMKAVYNHVIINKILRALGLSLKNISK